MHKFFKEKPIALEDELQFLFQSNMATGEFAYKPSSGIFPELEGDYHVTLHDEEDAGDDDNDNLELVPNWSSRVGTQLK